MRNKIFTLILPLLIPSFAYAASSASLLATTQGDESGPVAIVDTVTPDSPNTSGSTVTFDINPSAGAATAGSEYTNFTGATVPIPNVESSATYTVAVTNDTESEKTETVVTSISNSSDPAINISTASASANIVDNDLEVVDSPFYKIWNSFLDQINIEVLVNKSTQPVNLTASILDLNGNTLGHQDLVLQPKQEFDLIINDIPGYPRDTYGLVRVDVDRANSIEGHSAAYRLAVGSTGFDAGNEIDFDIIKPFSNQIQGESFAFFNTIQPSFNPADKNHIISQWVQLGNTDTSTQGFTVKKYDISGNEIQSVHFFVPAQGRRDVEGGHIVPGQNFVGLIRIIPDSPAARYISQVFQYSHDAVAGISPTSFSFAMGETTRAGTNLDQFLTISRGARAVNWIALSNAGATTGTANVRLIDNNGTELLNTNVTLSPYSQRHFLASDLLPEGHSGIAFIRSLSGSNIVSNTRSYYYQRNQSVSEAGLLEGRHLLGDKPNSIANTFLNQTNWLRIFNTSNASIHLDIEAYDRNGNVIGSKPLTLSAEHGIDLEAESNLGFNLPDNSYGVLRLVPDRPGAIFAETRRIKTFGTEIDLSQPIPFR